TPTSARYDGRRQPCRAARRGVRGNRYGDLTSSSLWSETGESLPGGGHKRLTGITQWYSGIPSRPRFSLGEGGGKCTPRSINICRTFCAHRYSGDFGSTLVW